MKTAFVVYDFDYINIPTYGGGIVEETKSVLVVCKTYAAAMDFIKEYNSKCFCEYLSKKNIEEVEYRE